MQENETETTASETTATEIESGAENSATENEITNETSLTTPDDENTDETALAEPEEEEEITYHAVQKEDSVTAIWEMQGRKHIRTIDPRSREGAEILRLFTAEEGEEEAAAA